ncbi:hypothetical protein JCM6882_006934 [Rhodosporidiobolus microsporus]
MSTALVFGANGVSGLALLDALTASSSLEWKKIIAVSRRPPVLDHQDDRVKFVSVDLLGDVDDLASKLQEAGGEEATHVAFYAYVAKSEENELIEVNRKLFGNSLEAVSRVAPNVKAFLLQTGYKYYGVHKGGKYLAPTPFKEDAPRHRGDNFYFVQEDMLREAAQKNGWGWLVVRPNFIHGVSLGNFMSFATTVALYASARKAANQPLVFPGSSASYNLKYDHSTASNNAAFQLFALQNEKAYNRTFNIHDGQPVAWNKLWAKIADYFGVKLASPPVDPLPSSSTAGEDVAILHSTAEWSASQQSTFDNLVAEQGLDKKAFDYATWDFLDFGTARTWPDQASLDEARSIGWDKSVDTFEEGFKKVFERLKELKVIPK